MKTRLWFTGSSFRQREVQSHYFEKLNTLLCQTKACFQRNSDTNFFMKEVDSRRIMRRDKTVQRCSILLGIMLCVYETIQTKDMMVQLTALWDRGVSSSLEAVDMRLAADLRRLSAPGDGEDASESDSSEIGLCEPKNKNS